MPQPHVHLRKVPGHDQTKEVVRENEVKNILDSNEQSAIMLIACYGIVNRMYKEQCKKHVAEEVKRIVHIAGESSLRAREDLETANDKVITLQNELGGLNKKNNWLETEISRLQRIEKEKAPQLKELKKEIKAFNHQQRAHAQAHA